MEEVSLLILAGGRASRYKALKQIDQIDQEGHTIMDYSIYDAKKVGFNKVVFLINRDIEEEFKASVGSRIEKHMTVSYVYQDIENIPEGFSVPENRTKPWGTAHGILSTIDEIKGPFAVINADDFYGRSSFQLIYDSLIENSKEECKYSMVGFLLENTLTENGYVSRGVCQVEDDYLESIEERTHIKRDGQRIVYCEGDKTYLLNGNDIVSMNLWGFNKGFLNELKKRFPKYLEEGLKKDPLGWECYPTLVLNDIIREGLGSIKVLKSEEKWLGVTYRKDKAKVVKSIKALKDQGIYPKYLWEVAHGQ